VSLAVLILLLFTPTVLFNAEDRGVVVTLERPVGEAVAAAERAICRVMGGTPWAVLPLAYRIQVLRPSGQGALVPDGAEIPGVLRGCGPAR
jgi:hypothetical protein